jgi:hypothetical protein
MSSERSDAYGDLVHAPFKHIILPPDPLDILDRHPEHTRVDLPQLPHFRLLLPGRPRLTLLDELDELEPDGRSERVEANVGEGELVGFRNDGAGGEVV